MADKIKDLFELKNNKLVWKVSRGRVTAGQPAGTDHGDGYQTVRVNGKAIYAHRIVQELATGKKVKGEVDHKNKKRSDNKPSNLKTVTRSENNKNRKGWKNKK